MGWRYCVAVPRLDRTSLALLTFAATLGAHGCVERPDATACEAAGKRMISLYQAHKETTGDTGPSKLGDKDLETFKKGCVLRGTVKEVRCVREAQSWPDVESCIE